MSGRLIASAPASWAATHILFMKSRSVLVASSQENITLRPWSLAYSMVDTAFSTTWSGVILSLYFMWRSLVAMKVWM